MPIAGENREDRANAHLRWADRYSNYGDVHKATAHFRRAMEYTQSRFGAGDEGPELQNIQWKENTPNTTWYNASLRGTPVTIGVRPNKDGWTGVGVSYVGTTEKLLDLTIVPIGGDKEAEVRKLTNLSPLPNASGNQGYDDDLQELHTKAKNTRVVFVEFTRGVLDLKMRLAWDLVAFLLTKDEIDDDSLVVTSVLDESEDALRLHNFKPLGDSMMANTAKDLAGAGGSNKMQKR
jgi:hypothetical protein